MVETVIQGGGGNRLSRGQSRTPITLRRSLALGDVLCATVVSDKLAERGFDVTFQAHPAAHSILRRCRNLAGFTAPGGQPHVNLDRAYEDDPDRTRKHFHRMFVDRSNQQLAHLGVNLGPPTNCKPRLVVNDSEREMARAKFADYPKPWVFICPRSETYPHRQIHDGVWAEMVQRIGGTKFWLGLHPAPAGIVDLKCTHFDTLMVWLSAADLLLTVDTGPMHVAAALGIPIVAASQSSAPDLHLNDQNDYVSVATDLSCLNCQKSLCPINPITPPCQQVNVDGMVNWANARLRGQAGESISAVIAIYQPDVEILNRCLAHVLPQVDEIVVTRAQDGILPDGATRHPKILYVQAPGTRIGYGRNLNYGARWSNGKYLLLLNDDVFLEPGAVELMLKEMRPAVGLVSHLLRYPDGKIYHAGVFRQPGQRDWGHIDHGAWHPTFKEPVELENVCGTSVLVRRETHFKIGGFDEDFFLYSEDNDYAMRVRLHGWKIMFTPHARGTHVGHLSTNKVGDIHGFIKTSNELFHQRWGPYLRHNANNNMGTFDYLQNA
jgi:GT2 family glycosyltransferase